MMTLKETPISCSCKADISENQTQSPILCVAELQNKLNSQTHRVSFVKVKMLIGKKWDSENHYGMVGQILIKLGSLNT